MVTQNDLAIFRGLLIAHCKSITKARTEVFTALHGEQPLTMRELETKLQARIDRASMYRTIELFESANIVKKVYYGWKYRIELSEEFNPHHHHLRCIQCSRVYTFQEPKEIDRIIAMAAEQHNFSPQSHQFEIEGLCQSCKA